MLTQPGVMSHSNNGSKVFPVRTPEEPHKQCSGFSGACPNPATCFYQKKPVCFACYRRLRNELSMLRRKYWTEDRERQGVRREQ